MCVDQNWYNELEDPSVLPLIPAHLWKSLYKDDRAQCLMVNKPASVTTAVIRRGLLYAYWQKPSGVSNSLVSHRGIVTVLYNTVLKPSMQYNMMEYSLVLMFLQEFPWMAKT